MLFTIISSPQENIARTYFFEFFEIEMDTLTMNENCYFFDTMSELMILKIQWINSMIASKLNPENNPRVPPMLPNLSANATLRDLFNVMNVGPSIRMISSDLSSVFIFSHIFFQ